MAKRNSSKPNRGDARAKREVARRPAPFKARRKVRPDPGPAEPQPPEVAVPRFPIVGLGASAGGLEAFEKFFRLMPADSTMAFVLVQHLDPRHASVMAELLSKFTRMPVQQAPISNPLDGLPRELRAL